MTAQDRLAAIAAEHEETLDYDTIGYDVAYSCMCGRMELAHGHSGYAAHIAAVIASADSLAVIELPKPEPDVDRPTFDAGCGAIVHAEPEGDVRLHSVAWIAGRYGGMFRSPRTAVQLAAALLAAAKAAEGVARDVE